MVALAGCPLTGGAGHFRVGDRVAGGSDGMGYPVESPYAYEAEEGRDAARFETAHAHATRTNGRATIPAAVGSASTAACRWVDQVNYDPCRSWAADYSDEIPRADGLYTVDEQSYHRDRGPISVSGAKLPCCRQLFPSKFKGAWTTRRTTPRFVCRLGSRPHSLDAGSDTWCWSRRCTPLKNDSTVADSRPPKRRHGTRRRRRSSSTGKIPIHVDDSRAQAMADSVATITGELFRHSGPCRWASIYWTDCHNPAMRRGRHRLADAGR